MKIKRGLWRSPVIHADETGLRINGRLGYVHVASTPRLTHYAAAAHRGQTAILEINVLPRYRGTCVHDGWLAYSSYTHCRHALCGVHLLRELTYFAELGAETKEWAAPLTELLLEMKAEVERVSAEGGQRLAADKLAALTASYDQLIAAGLKAPPAAGVPEAVSKQGRSLLLRLERSGRWGQFSGVGKITPHDPRSTVITELLNRGHSYREVQMVTKHKDPKTVMRYEHARENLDKNPINTFDYEA